ncbi:hypothetical protein PIB30_083619 [Stylosanthes scabra]|uniref:Transposase MuDR plant domain-containing protein n=1 Tax=Stylosanthes scabra TaxID=79078 RepID=A0ABU6UR52_9FABA|nr:hypothetical protein [Stylosanthes scabra]
MGTPIVVAVYPNATITRKVDGAYFEDSHPIVIQTWRLHSLAELKSLILVNMGVLGVKHVRKIAYRCIALDAEQNIRYRIFWLRGDDNVCAMFDCHGKIVKDQVMELCIELVNVREVDLSSYEVGSSSREARPKEEWVPTSSDDDSENDAEYVPETRLYLASSSQQILPPPNPLPSRAPFQSDYDTLDLNAMQLDPMPFGPGGANDYNLDGSVEFWVGHRLWSREAVHLAIKNYSIRKSVEYKVIESDRAKYHCRCRHYASGCR